MPGEDAEGRGPASREPGLGAGRGGGGIAAAAAGITLGLRRPTLAQQLRVASVKTVLRRQCSSSGTAPEVSGAEAGPGSVRPASAESRPPAHSGHPHPGRRRLPGILHPVGSGERRKAPRA